MRTTTLLFSIFLLQVISCEAIGNRIFMFSGINSANSGTFLFSLNREGGNDSADDPKTIKDEGFRQFLIESDSLSLSRTWELVEAGSLSFAGDSSVFAFRLEDSSAASKDDFKENGLAHACRYFLQTAASHPEERIREIAATYSAKARGLLKKLRDAD